MSRLALVTGATGYIGAHLVPALLDSGWAVRVLARHPERVAEAWRDRVEITAGDAGNADDLRAALDGVQVAYYLLHSMDRSGADFRGRDKELAHGFARAASDAGVQRIVYLSGLHPAGEHLSDHLGSRVEVGEILLGSGVPTAVLQAGVVLGAGSASFDMLRHLTERLPAATGPRWLANLIQPIAIDDVVHYLVRAADLPADVNRTIDIGMDEVLTYAQMMRRYAAVTGIGPRWIGTIPVLTPGLASHWVGLVTPVDAAIARPLVGSLIHDAITHESDAGHLLGDPPGGLTGFDEAVRRATASIDPHRWNRTLAAVGASVVGTAVLGGLLTDPGGRWFRALRKPSWNPPDWVFGPVWTTLYAAIVVAATSTICDLEESGHAEEARTFRTALAVNLVLNAGWSGVFFRARRLGPATVVAGLLALSSADLARRAASAGPGKALALGGYAGWTSFATALSGTIARLNRRPD